MVSQSAKSKELLNAIQGVSKTFYGKEITQELLSYSIEIVKPIADFFELSTFDAVVFSFYIERGLRNRSVDSDNLIDFFGKDLEWIADVYQSVENLLTRRLLLVDFSRFNYRRQNTEKTINSKIHPRVINAVLKGDSRLLEYETFVDFFDFLDKVNEIKGMASDAEISKKSMVAEILSMIESNQHLPEIKWLSSIDGLLDTDMVVILFLCIAYVDEETIVEYTKVAREICSSPKDINTLRKSILDGASILFKKDIIEFPNGNIRLNDLVRLTDNALEALLSGFKNNLSNQFVPRTGIIIPCDSIIEENLIYNINEKKHIDIITNALADGNFHFIKEKIKSQGHNIGFTVLLHGYPGTGKTSTIKQIAKQTNRHIFFVEMHKIQSKWVGESEKNIAKIFDEYRAFSKTVDRTPILVFNEADAIFSKRINVVSSVDQMNNSLQNILLEILENFEGIFFATSNLIQNLDSAFDRRLLYKIEFQKPEEETRLKILLTNFETISQDLLIGINKEFCLTGGQIINVKKKYSISTLLNMGTDENELLYNLCKDEISFQKSSLREIGFRINKCKSIAPNN